jgi:transposase-like protein
MFPVAYEFFESESKDSWTWFLLQLHKAIGEPHLLALHCDASKGLIGALKDVFPHTEMRECFRHLMQNYIEQFAGKEHMYPVARAYRSQVHEQHKANVVGIDGLVKWFKDNNSLLWYRSGFNPDIKCDYITNTIAEVFNNWIKDHKDLNICELADKIRVKIMELFFRRRRIGEKLEGKILPSIINILRARTRGLGHLSLA